MPLKTPKRLACPGGPKSIRKAREKRSIPEEIKQERYNKVMGLSARISAERLERKVGSTIDDVRTHQAAGTVVAVDVDEGWVEVKRATSREAARPDGLVQAEIIRSDAMRQSLLRLGECALAGQDSLGKSGMSMYPAHVHRRTDR